MAAKKRATGPAPAPLTQNPFKALAAHPAPAPAPAPAAPAAEPKAASEAEPAQRPPLAGLTTKLVVRREVKGRGGKTVTRIIGLPAREVDALAGQLKRRLGCGAVRDGDDLLLLGDLVDRAADWLTGQGAPRIVKGN